MAMVGCGVILSFNAATETHRALVSAATARFSLAGLSLTRIAREEGKKASGEEEKTKKTKKKEEEEADAGEIVVRVVAKDEDVEARAAERMKVYKPVRGAGGALRRVLFTAAERDSFEEARPGELFSLSEKQQIVWHLLESVEVGAEIGKMYETEATSPLIYTLQSALPGDGHVLLADVVHEHEEATKLAIWQGCFRSLWTDPVHMIRDYYGEEVSLYFAWMQFFTFWLIPPAMLGLFLYMHRAPDVTVDDSPYLPFYGLFVVLWALLFVRFWERRCAEYACQWGTLRMTGSESLDDVDDLRPEFHGELRRSPVTGEMERFYPQWKRQAAYLWSFVVTGCMLCVAVVVMICSFNLQGYMSDKTSVFHIQALHKYSDPGAVFDPNGNFLIALVPVVLHSIVIMQLNNLYRHVAEWLTDLENHRTRQAHENAMILKRFLFEACDCYMPLFYLAFYELDAELVRLELVALYTSDSVRRVVTESLIPWLLAKVSSTTKQKDQDGTVIAQLDKQRALDEYEQFDDYLEMCIQFGYITLFASAFPLASMLSIVCNLIEVRSDAFKLSFVARKPQSRRASQIGTWLKVLTFQAWLSIFTNCMIFGFSSEQMGEWFPSLFKHVGGTERVIIGYEAGNPQYADTEVFAAGKGRYAVGIVFAIEHVLILVGLALFFVLNKWPLAVREEISRRDFELKRRSRSRDRQLHRLLHKSN